MLEFSQLDYFLFQLNAELFVHLLLEHIGQLPDVIRRRRTGIDDDIGMFFKDPCAADRHPFGAHLFKQTSCRDSSVWPAGIRDIFEKTAG